MVPQVEFDELEGRSIFAATIAWDNAASWTYQRVIDALGATKWQLSSVSMSVEKKIPHSHIVANTHLPGKASWDHAVKHDLQIISRNVPILIKAYRSSMLKTFKKSLDEGAFSFVIEVEPLA